MTQHQNTIFPRDEIEKNAESWLKRLSPISKPIKSPTPVRILYNGQFLILPSGKTIWKSVGDAKNALRYAFEHSNLQNSLFIFDPPRPLAMNIDWGAAKVYSYDDTNCFYTSKETGIILEEIYQQVCKKVSFVRVQPNNPNILDSCDDSK